MSRRTVLGVLGALAALLTLVTMAANSEPIEFQARSEIDEGGARSRPVGGGDARDAPPDLQQAEPIEPREAAELPDWLGWIILVPAGVATIWLLSRQRIQFLRGVRRTKTDKHDSELTAEQTDVAIATFAEDLIGELELGADPRQAILRAYATVEGGLGVRELERRPTETPLQYLDRVFGRRSSAGPALARLTDLFQVARFSSEPIDSAMRAGAIDALSELRNAYQGSRVRIP